MAFNLSSSAITKLPMFPAPTTAKERKTISSFVSGRESSGDGEISRWQGQYLVLLIHCCSRICPTHSMTHQGSSIGKYYVSIDYTPRLSVRSEMSLNVVEGRQQPRFTLPTTRQSGRSPCTFPESSWMLFFQTRVRTGSRTVPG